MEDIKTKNYEIAFLVQNDSDTEHVLKHLADVGAEITNEGSVSPIRLAYPIKKINQAYFGFMHFSLDPASLKNLNAALQLDKNILRYIVVTPPPVFKAVRKPVEKKEPKKQPDFTQVSNEALVEELAALQGKENS